MVLGAAGAAAIGGGVLVGIVDDGQLVEGGGDILGDEEGGTVGHFVLFWLDCHLRVCKSRRIEERTLCRVGGIYVVVVMQTV